MVFHFVPLEHLLELLCRRVFYNFLFFTWHVEPLSKLSYVYVQIQVTRAKLEFFFIIYIHIYLCAAYDFKITSFFSSRDFREGIYKHINHCF